MSSEDDGNRTDPLMRNMPDSNTYEPDVEALSVLGDRLVVAVGVESNQELAARGGRSVAEALGLPVTEVPLGLNPKGLPLGVQVAAADGNDHLTIAAALALERRFGGWSPPA